MAARLGRGDTENLHKRLVSVRIYLIVVVPISLYKAIFYRECVVGFCFRFIAMSYRQVFVRERSNGVFSQVAGGVCRGAGIVIF